MKGGIFQRRGVFYTNVWHPVEKRKVKERVGTDKKAALTRAAQLKAQFMSLSRRSPLAMSMPRLSEYIQVVLEEHYASLSSRPNAVRALNYLLEFAGDIRLDAVSKGLIERYKYKRLRDKLPHPFKTGNVDPGRIAAWQAENSETVGKTTINRELEVIKRMMNHAVENEILPVSPIACVRKYRGQATRQGKVKRHLLDQELAALREGASRSRRKNLLAIIDLFVLTARRRTDLLKLRVRDYDRRNGTVFLSNTKDGEAQWIPVPPKAQVILDRLVDDAKGEWIFPGRLGNGPVKDVDTAFNVAKRRAGLPWLRFHDLRHTGISYMVMAGIDMKTIAEQVGHSSATMIDKRYGHLSPAHRAASAVIFGTYMDRVMGKADTTDAHLPSSRLTMPTPEPAPGRAT